jgi:hypothetical protein
LQGKCWHIIIIIKGTKGMHRNPNWFESMFDYPTADEFSAVSHKVHPNLIKILSFVLVFVAMVLLLLSSCSRKSSRFEIFFEN